MRDILFIRGVKNVNSSLGDNECMNHYGPHYWTMKRCKASENHVTNKIYTESWYSYYDFSLER